MPFYRPESVASTIKLDRYSMYRMNIYGEMGLSCRIPHDGIKVSKQPPFNKIEMDIEETQDIIQLFHLLGNPK